MHKDFAMLTPKLNAMFNFPVCYHPTTILSVDDEPEFLEILSAQVADALVLLCFNNPEEAMTYTKNHHHYLPFRERCFSSDAIEKNKIDIQTIRNEVYNNDRFKEIYINVTDYDMPHIDGVELTKTMEFKAEIPRYSHIFLSGKISEDFKKKIKNTDYIGKDDPDFIEKLYAAIKKRALTIFQMYSHELARTLARDANEKPAILFDGHFCSIFNQILIENDICEFYLYDRQGSFLMLDEDANLSWLFIRNEQGIHNAIEIAKQFGAPQDIIKMLESKEYILTLYEQEDLSSKKNIDWNDYVKAAKTFVSNDDYLKFWRDLKPSSSPTYYYCYTKHFPNHNIQQSQIISYGDFLDAQE